VSLFNPIVYLISGFRWSFYGTSEVNIGSSLAVAGSILAACLGVVALIFKTGYRLKN
jgi:ABC-2 type transport system permease protein